MGSESKGPWYEFTLAQIDLKARCLCASEVLERLAQYLLSVTLSDADRTIISSKLTSMILEHASQYEQSAISRLTLLVKQLQQLSWYMGMLEQISECAGEECRMQELMELGDCLCFSTMEEQEWEEVVAELDRMVQDESGKYTKTSLKYLASLHQRIAGP